jgi:hypothetical protein
MNRDEVIRLAMKAGLLEWAADRRCTRFEYQPGTDEVEHDTERNDPRTLAARKKHHAA